MKVFFYYLIALIGAQNALAQLPPDSLWSQRFVGQPLYSSYDVNCNGVIQTPDGGYIITGRENLDPGGDSDQDDFFLMKTDPDGNQLWQQSWGLTGSGNDVQLTLDGYYIVASSGFNSLAYLLKTNGQGGGWLNFYGYFREGFNSVRQTSDSGYVAAGFHYVSPTTNDFYVVKTNSDGDSLWQRKFGGTGDEICYAVRQTGDGGYVLAGKTNSNLGAYNMYLVKINAAGSLQWSKTYGGSGVDVCTSCLQTSDGGYLLAGYTNSFGAGGYDMWIVKTNANGDSLWSRTIGGSGDDRCFSLTQVVGNDYVLAGTSSSFGSGLEDFYLVKMDASGNVRWNRPFGGNGTDQCASAIQTADRGFMLVGKTWSWNGQNNPDMWLVRTGPDRTSLTQWNNPAGGAWSDSTNWSPQHVPGSTDSALIVLPGNYTVTVSQNQSIGTLILGSGIPGDPTHQTLLVTCAGCSLSVYASSVVRPSGTLGAASSGIIALINPGIDLTDSGAIQLANTSALHLQTTDSLLMITGNLFLSDIANLFGGRILNAGTIMRNTIGASVISASYRDQGTPGNQRLMMNGGTLTINAPDSAVITTATQIADGANLSTFNTRFKNTSTVDGAGRLSFVGGTENFLGNFPLTGALHVTGGAVTFQPQTAIQLDTFLISSSAVFSSPNTVHAGVVAMNGGSTSANIIPGTLWQWTAGAYSGAANSTLPIAPGCSLAVSGSGNKTLDTRDILLDGAAFWGGSGTLTLLNTPSVTIDPGVTLTVGDSILVSGVGDTLINRGQIVASCPLDSCVLNMFIWNTSGSRTPGTIDIPSGCITINRVRNEGTVIVNAAGVLRVTGNCDNSSLMDMQENTIFVEHDSLFNRSTGIINLAGGAELGGNGVIENAGQVHRLGTGLLTTTESLINAQFHNLAGTGILNVIVDTLTLGNSVCDNAGTINIYTGAALTAPSSFCNLPGGQIIGGGSLNIVLNTLVIRYQNNTLMLFWTPVPGATRYDVYAAPFDDPAQYQIISTVYQAAYSEYQGASLPKRFYRVVSWSTP